LDGATKTRKVATSKLTACYATLKISDCAQPLQARATAIAGKKFKEGAPSQGRQVHTLLHAVRRLGRPLCAQPAWRVAAAAGCGNAAVRRVELP
jgi:hypothetical protein